MSGEHKDLDNRQLTQSLGKVGVALSGGGVRATVFHLGVLARLAKDDLLESISFISSVSGGSLAVGLVYSTNDYVWPGSKVYLSEVLPAVQQKLTSATIQWSYIWRSIALPWRLLRGRAHILAKVIEQQWGVCGTLSQLPAVPRWAINATCYETGKNWRFSQPRMGDYTTHYVIDPSFPLADAMAASAALPGLIGPLVVRTQEFEWHAFKASGEHTPVAARSKRYELWDGGVYDNLGLEPLFKPAVGIRSGVDFIIVSDASAPLEFAPRSISRMLKPGHRALRLVDVATDQVRALRARSVVAEFARNPGCGVYLRMGNTSAAIYSAVNEQAPSLRFMTSADVKRSATMSTTLRRLEHHEFEALLRHGFEVTDATLCSRVGDQFLPVEYTPQ